ncbi:MAG: hypothetical protein AB7I18_12095 [Candidatus Berkiella sp.]
MLEGVTDNVVEQLRQGQPIQDIEERLRLSISLLRYAMLNDKENLIDALYNYSDFDFNQPNAAGETIAHHIPEMNNAKALFRLREWVLAGRVNITLQTKIFSNFLHYATHLTVPKLLKICFSLASVDMLVAQNQLGNSPLSLAVQQDNADFLREAFKAFPQLISLESTYSGFSTSCDWLLHEIARTGAHKCFAVLREQFTEGVWAELQAYRNQDDERPIDTAALAGQRTLFQMLKGYRTKEGAPTLQWLSMLEIAQQQNPPNLNSWGEMLGEARSEIQLRQQEMELSSSSESDEEIDDADYLCNKRHLRA